MKNFVLRYGLYAGCILIVLGLANWLLLRGAGMTVSQIFGYASFVVALGTVPLGIKYFRDQLNSGAVSFGEGAKIGFGITTIASIIMGLYSMLFYVFQGDKFLEWYEKSMTAEEWAQAQDQMAAMGDFAMAPWFQGIIMFVTLFIFGTVITLISALILKRN